jgi:hypothetical protein
MLNITSVPPIAGNQGHRFKNFPCVPVYVSAPNSPEPEQLTEVWGLIDTGADHVFVDIGFMMSRGGNPISSRPVNEREQGLIFEAILAVPPFIIPSRVQVCGIDLARMNVPYQVVLGRQFLADLRLEYEPAQGIQRLTRPLFPISRADRV